MCSIKVIAIMLIGSHLVTSQAENYYTCKNPHGTKGLCKPIKECPPLLTLIKTEPLTPETIAFLRQSQCLEEKKSGPYVCCETDPKESTFSTRTDPEDDPNVPEKEIASGSDSSKVY